jgi:hypothetical protein
MVLNWMQLMQILVKSDKVDRYNRLCCPLFGEHKHIPFKIYFWV